MLIDITNKITPVRSEDAERYELLQSSKKQLGSNRFSKCCRIIDYELDKLYRLGQTKRKMVFTKHGFTSENYINEPSEDIPYIWECAELVYPSHNNDEIAADVQRKFVGGLVRWRISLRKETWLVYRQPSGKYRKHNGKEILVSKYWVDNNFTYTSPKRTTEIKSRPFLRGPL